ncbi:MAG: hypothetical protein HOP28_10305 [Gemmatimonadales bacterium]|nr:hypothetical protein [Gemmatimonadales bacterium]
MPIRHVATALVVSLGAGAGTSAGAQTVVLPLTPAEWTATDSIRFETYLGRPSIYINKGVALSRSATFRNGTLEFDMAAGPKSNNLGIAFRAERPDAFEVLFFRPGASGTIDATQYAPAINGVAAAWQIYHGAGANARATLPREAWIHVKLQVVADSAIVYLNNATTPTLTIPRLRLAGSGTGIGLWGSNFGLGAYFSNISYTVDNAPFTSVAPALPAGTIEAWQLSEALDAPDLVPGTLPDLRRLTWESVRAESPGLVLVNRYRRAPGISAPADEDSVLRGRVAGSKVVFARTTIESDRERLRLLHFGYSDNVVIYCNGRPIYSGVNPAFFRSLGNFDPIGNAVYLPLRKGRNEIVYAVTEFFGGWAFSGRLDK